MASVDSSPGRAKKGKGKKSHKAKRVGVRVDMTPMVDVAFLLLTFFMFTTSLTQPQVMEITMPPNTENIKVPESDLLTLLVRKDESIFWKAGRNPAEPVAFSKLRSLLVARNKENPKLITALRLDRHASYQGLVNMLDEINLSEGALLMALGPGSHHDRRFSLATMTDDDHKEVDNK
jgi:biopolymer transport protein ExbD